MEKQNENKPQKRKQSFIKSILSAEFGIGKEKNQFIENLALMMSSGIDILSALASLQNEVKSKALKRYIQFALEDVQNGLPVWRALSENNILAPNLVSIVRIGEESGNLEKNLRIVINQQQKEKEFKSKLQSASLYPGIVLFVMVFVGGFVATFVIPRLTEVYSSLRIELPTITKIMIEFGAFMQKNGTVVIPAAIIIFVIIFYILFVFKRTKFIGQKILFNLPIIKNIILELQISKLGYFIYLLLDSGFPIVDALNILSTSTDMHQYKKLYSYLANQLSNGQTFEQSFSNYPRLSKYIPFYPKELIVNGEKSGNLPESFLKIGDTYEKKSENTTKNLGTLFEPILLIVVWIGVAGLALSVILPIYSLVGNFSSVASDGTTQPTAETPITPETPTDKPTTPTKPAKKKRLQILNTGTTFLNIRDAINGKVIGQAAIGEIFEYKQLKDGWYQIVMKNKKLGWVVARYAKVI